MKTHLPISILCLLNCFCAIGQTNTNAVKEIMLDIRPSNPNSRAIIAVNPYLIPNKHIETFKRQSLSEQLLSTTQIDQILTDIQASVNFIWSPILLENAELVSSKAYDSLVLLNSPCIIYKFSKPAFTTDKTYSLVYESWECGPLCGGWKMTLFKKVEKHWNLIHTYLYSAE